MRYLPHSDADIRDMLGRIGVSAIDDLFATIPPDYVRREPLELEPALDEATLMSHVAALSEQQRRPRASFMGAGMYDHHIPPAVDQLLLRSEFYTAYTPYQAEVAQGTLQAIFEFQTTVCELFGMEVANASMYDGASAAAEAALMARRITGRKRIVVSAGVHPEYQDTLRTYLTGLAGGGTPELDIAPVTPGGETDATKLAPLLGDDVAAIMIGYPNFFGTLEDLRSAKRLAQEHGALLIVANWEPYALGVAASPGELGADIVVGEGQALAVPPQFGGPGVGLFACRKAHVRQIPGRLVGETVDKDNERGFVLTLSTREQHIRRERATSNICTNHGLIALAMTIRTALLGKKGFSEVSRLCLARAEYLKEKIRASEHLELVSSGPTFNEFVIRDTRTSTVQNRLADLAATGFFAGVSLDRWYDGRKGQFLVAVTEQNPREQIDELVEALEA